MSTVSGALLAALQPWAFGFVLVFCRIGAAMMLLPGIAPAIPVPPEAGVQAGFMMAAEIIIGLWLGLLARLMVVVLPIAGQFIAYLLGIVNGRGRRWQHQLAHAAQHRLVRPRGLRHQMPQRLVLRRGPLRCGHRRQRLNALASFGHNQAGLITGIVTVLVQTSFLLTMRCASTSRGSVLRPDASACLGPTVWLRRRSRW